MHGWPGSVVEFLDVIPRLTDPGGSRRSRRRRLPRDRALAAGLRFLGAPAHARLGRASHRKGVQRADVAASGYTRYGAQGGDWGAQLATRIGPLDPEHCAAIHLNMPIAGPPEDPGPLTDEEKADLAAMQHFQREESGYAQEQGTKPQTLGMALNDSPAGLLAWIVEKFRTWSDCDGHPENSFTRDQLLTNVMLYWVTQTITSSVRLYWESQHSGMLGGSAGVRRSSHRRRALSQGRDPAPPTRLGRTTVQRHALGRPAARRSFRRDGAARAVRRRPAELLPNDALNDRVVR